MFPCLKYIGNSLVGLVLSLWEPREENHPSIESGENLHICEAFCNRYLRQQIPNSVNDLEYLEGEPARLGGAGKFCCSIAGEEVDGEGKKRTRARVKTSIGRRVVILSSRCMPEKFNFKSLLHMFICYLLRSLRAKRLKKRVLGIKQDLVSEPL